ncbi:MAG TPA: hypothetical protein VJT49_01185 [Amycolatopsis sp.]|nr:hypothetical protein [Amycolatopsis sp.]HKS43728.1 hypothetical protein [Amycolatopsis sp.]
MDEGLHDAAEGFHAAGVGSGLYVSAEGLQDGGVGQFRCGGLVHQQSEFVAAGALFGELGGEFLDARRAGFLVHGAVLECGEVAVDGVLVLGDVAFEGGEFGGVGGALVVDLAGGVSQALLDEVATGEGVHKRGQYGAFELIGGQPVGGAVFGAVAVPGEAGVVAVAVLVAFRGGAEVALAAVGAEQSPDQGVVGVGDGAVSGFVAAGVEDVLGVVEQLLADDRRVVVGGFVPAVAEPDLAEVGAVAQDGEHGSFGPGVPGLGAVAVGGQSLGDELGTEFVVDVHGEDAFHDWLLVVDDDELAAAADFVTVGAVAAGPFAAGGFAFHAVDDAVDDGGAFELGEHRQHLHHHATGGGGGVEGFGRRPERHARVFEVGEDLRQAPDRSGQPVHAVDQQHVEFPGPGGSEGAFQGGPVGGGPGFLIDVGVADEFPVVL